MQNRHTSCLDQLTTVAALVALALFADPASAQRTITWQVGTGPVTTIVDQAAGDLNPFVDFVTAAVAFVDPAGDFSITGTLTGFPFAVPPAGEGFAVNLTACAILALRDPGPFIVNNITVGYTFADDPLSGHVFAGANALGFYVNPISPLMRIGFTDVAVENHAGCTEFPTVIANPTFASDPQVGPIFFGESQTAYLGIVPAPGFMSVCARIPFILDRGGDTIVFPASAAASIASAPGLTPENAHAMQTGTIMENGPRPPANGDNFFNIEGANLGTFRSYGVARWDLNDIRAMLDGHFGYERWHITEIRLQLTQSNAAFSATGNMNLYYTQDDSTDIKTANSPLRYPFQDSPGSPDLPANVNEPLATFTFSPIANGAIDEFVIYQSGDQGERLVLADDVRAGSDGLLTLVFEDASQTPSVAATYRGQVGVPGRSPPALRVIVERNLCPLPGCDTPTGHVDLTGDCRIDLSDLAALLSGFGCTLGCSMTDIDGNGNTDINDLAILLSRFGSVCHP